MHGGRASFHPQAAGAYEHSKTRTRLTTFIISSHSYYCPGRLAATSEREPYSISPLFQQGLPSTVTFVKWLGAARWPRA